MFCYISGSCTYHLISCTFFNKFTTNASIEVVITAMASTMFWFLCNPLRLLISCGFIVRATCIVAQSPLEEGLCQTK